MPISLPQANVARYHPARAWRSEAFRFSSFLLLTLGLAGAQLAAFSLYEWGRLGEHQLGVRKPPYHAPYYVLRFALTALLSFAAVGGLYRLRGHACAIRRAALPAAHRRIAYAALAVAAVSVALFLADAELYYELALEDGLVEWASTILPLAASAAFVYAFVRVKRSPRRDPRRSVALALCPAFAAGLFVIGMEEISWMQRIFRIPTPDLFAANQQQEMNLHNMHSIAIAFVHHAVMFAWLIALPFVADAAPRNRLTDALADFMPGRLIVAGGATWTALNYNLWNYLGTQMIFLFTLAILVCYAQAARERGDRAEMAMFVAIAAFMLVAQPVILALGGNFVRMWDATEYQELLMAIGMTLFAWQVVTRLRLRYGRPDADGPVAPSRS